MGQKRIVTQNSRAHRDSAAEPTVQRYPIPGRSAATYEMMITGHVMCETHFETARDHLVQRDHSSLETHVTGVPLHLLLDTQFLLVYATVINSGNGDVSVGFNHRSETTLGSAMLDAGIQPPNERGANKATRLLQQAWVTHPHKSDGLERLAFVREALVDEALLHIMDEPPFNHSVDQAIGRALNQALKAEKDRQQNAARAATTSGPAGSRNPERAHPDVGQSDEGQQIIVASKPMASSSADPPTQEAIPPPKPIGVAPPASPPKTRHLTGIGPYITASQEQTMARKSFLDIRYVNDRPLRHTAVADGLQKADKAFVDVRKEMSKNHVAIWHAQFVRNLSSGVDDRSKTFGHYWSDRNHQEVDDLWYRSMPDAVGHLKKMADECGRDNTHAA